MRYQEQSFTLPASDLKGRNTHGQTWEDIFNSSPALPRCPCISAFETEVYVNGDLLCCVVCNRRLGSIPALLGKPDSLENHSVESI